MFLQRYALLLALGLAVFASAVPAAAQSSPKVELSGGYQFLRVTVDGEGLSMPKGWYADVASNVTEKIGIVFEVGGNYKRESETFVESGITATGTFNLRGDQFLGGPKSEDRVQSRSTAKPKA